MIQVAFLSRAGALCGFRLSGHAGGEAGRDIVCAAVSSAAQLAANTLTEVCGCRALVRMRDGYLFLSLASGTDSAAPTLEGLRRHLSALRAQYPRALRVETVLLPPRAT